MSARSALQAITRRIIPHGEDFFTPLRLLAECAKEATPQLESMLVSSHDAERIFRALEDIEKKGDDHVRDILSRLGNCFVTPIDREDISPLAHGLDDVVDLAESVGYRMFINIQACSGDIGVFNLHLADTKLLIQHLASAALHLPLAINGLEKPTRIDSLREEVHKCEKAGDEVWRRILSRHIEFLRARGKAPLTGDDCLVVQWVEGVCHNIEHCLDRTKQTVDLVANIIEKFA